jgi:hypothetical protein
MSDVLRNRFWLARAALLGGLAMAALSTRATVILTSTPAAGSDPYQATFNGGNDAIDTQPAITAAGASTTQGIAAGSGLIQTFQGNDQTLTGVGFYTPSTTGPAAGSSFTIGLIDYGASGPINSSSTQFNTVTTPSFTDSFAWNTSGTGQKRYFAFSDASSLLLDGTHYYGIFLQFPNTSGTNNFNRSNGDVYTSGRMAVGNPGSYSLSFAGGDRDANFALYTATAATPEPAAVGLIGLSAMATFGRRQRRERGTKRALKG